MKSKLKNALRSLWSRPDPVLAEAGVAGELLVAKIRLILATVLLLIPVLDSLFFPVEPKEAIVGLSLAAATFLGSIIIYLLISREYNPSWLSFASSSFDVTLISAGLALFLILNEPHTAVNSKVVFEGYFLAIGSTSLRYDKRVCVTAGLRTVCLVLRSLAVDHYADCIRAEPRSGCSQPETSAACNQRPTHGIV